MPPRQQFPHQWKATIRSWSPDDWRDYAAKRLNNLLKKHHVCSTREMEARLSDFGTNLLPPVHPHHLTTARKMLNLQVVSTNPRPLYSLPNISISSISSHIARKELLNDAFINHFTKEELCGDVAERIIFNSMCLALNLSIEPHNLGNVSQIGSRTTNKPLDTYALLPFTDNIGQRNVSVLGIEIKNIREWIYPESVEIWKALKSCVDLDCIPIIISRAFHYTAFTFFRDIGAFGHKTKHQYFSTKLWKHPLYSAVKKELYFRDMVLWKEDKPDLMVTNFFSDILPQHISRITQTFENHKQLINNYAQGPLHDERTHISDRSKLMSQFREDFKRLHKINQTQW